MKKGQVPEQVQCPRCGNDFTRRTLRQGLVEYLLSAVFVYPFRCQLCAHRFLQLRLGTRYNESTVDKRQFERVVGKFPVTFVGDKLSGAGTMSHLSLGGCAFETQAKLMEGMLMNLRLQPPDVTPPITVEAAIVRSVRPPATVGVEFLRVRPDEQYRLIQFVSGVLTADRQIE